MNYWVAASRRPGLRSCDSTADLNLIVYYGNYVFPIWGRFQSNEHAVDDSAISAAQMVGCQLILTKGKR